MIKYIHIVLATWILAAGSIGFSESFPNRPTAGELEEIVEQGITCGNAVIERDVVVNRNQNFFPYCGHGQSYFASLQTELENLPPLYVDDVDGPLNAYSNDFRYFTLATWQAAAGCTNGFRRATEQDGTNTPSFIYGHAQAGDIIGSWIFEDLQKGFSALRWVPYFPNLSSLKVVFPDDISGQAKLVASGSGPVWKGIYYALTYDDSGIIGDSGTYNLDLDSRSNFSPTGYSGRSFVAFGSDYNKCNIQFDCGGEDPPQNYNYSFELELEDSSDVVGIAGIDCYYYSTSIKSASIVGNTILAAATLSSRSDVGGEYAMFYAFPYCKVPFANK